MSSDFSLNNLDALLEENNAQVIHQPFSGIPTLDQVKGMMKPDGTVDRDAVYLKLAQMIAATEQVMGNFAGVDINAEGTLSGMSSVIMAMKSLLAEFTKIHQQMSDFDRKIAIEQSKIEGRKEIMRLQHEYKMEQIKAEKGLTDDDAQNPDRIAYSREALFKAVREASSKQKKLGE